jgi:hypothetical protein
MQFTTKHLRLFPDAEAKSLPLTELDGLYRQAISQLPVCIRIEYCERLISRTEFQLRQTGCRAEIGELKLILKAAKTEIHKCTLDLP